MSLNCSALSPLLYILQEHQWLYIPQIQRNLHPQTWLPLPRTQEHLRQVAPLRPIPKVLESCAQPPTCSSTSARSIISKLSRGPRTDPVDLRDLPSEACEWSWRPDDSRPWFVAQPSAVHPYHRLTGKGPVVYPFLSCQSPSQPLDPLQADPAL